ncbi:MAG: putative glycoside hydrolase [Parcubacteria group bacterium]
MRKSPKRYKEILFLSVLIITVSLFFFLPQILTIHYVSDQKSNIVSSQKNEVVKVFAPSYVLTPDSVKGIYMTSWVASVPQLRDKLIKIIDETELNTIVIDIKDYTGNIFFPISSTELNSFGSGNSRIKDLQEVIENLHKKGIYVIGRIAVFQDAYFVKYRPDLAVKNKAGTSVWKDRKGISWIDPGSEEYWKYIVLISRESRKIGFDEINLDYIRYPSDGNMKDISFPLSSTTPKSVVLGEFFKYMSDHLFDSGLKISGDLFGMTTTASDDMGIGQLLETALPHFDYIMPMVYPSHYPANFNNYKNPAKHPYEVVKFAMQSAVDRANLASTSPLKFRPWLQDFDLGADYGPEEVRAQIKATYDVGLNSWILWSASNTYTEGALNKESI